MFPEYQQLIDEANARVYEVAQKTSLDYMPQLSAQLDNAVWLKREDQQSVFSYKIRGAYNLLRSLDEQQRSRGVITASAGNHAQGVALAAAKLGLTATIVMPKTTPEIKVKAVRQHKGEVILHGNNYDEAHEHALEVAKAGGMEYIPPYDHPLIIAGQATVAVELEQQLQQGCDYIFVPIGGGGLASGIALYMKDKHPQIKIIGVEPDEAACMHAALDAGERVTLERIGIFADGASVKQAGEETFRICRALLDEVVTVSVDEICAAVKDIFEDTRCIPEPAGALALAGLKQFTAGHDIHGNTLVAILSGANVNFDRLRHIAELSALGEQREALICVGIPERPGSFQKLCHDLGPRQITEFNYRYSDRQQARVFAGIQLHDGVAEKDQLIAGLQGKGYDVVDMSRNEVAKMHIRYMVGGHVGDITDEVLYRFEFPERSGALLQFLKLMGDRWNISLFHYRNHGAAYGRVLMGIQVPSAQRQEFQQFLDQLDINYSEETDNPAYRTFLA
ncbi:MAG: threonine ammonia-lyase, biosynthetic [Gammaproteobacteria bacterium]